MKISYEWIKELVPDLTLNPTELAQLLTMHSFETDVETSRVLDPKIIVAKITKLEPHPNADRLKLATISTGEIEIRVVCGAPNINEGDIIPYAPPGTVVKDEEGNDFMLKEAIIRGEASPGMLNSPRELGMSNWHGGIWVLPADTSIGTPLSELIPDDTILDADITPNRAHDCMSHVGIAREVASLLKLKVTDLDTETMPEPQDSVNGWTITIQDPGHTPRYIGALLTGAEVGPSPLWMQARLFAVGARPINNLVDITNYVMFELGNPTHLFDAKRLPGKKMGVRFATKEETVTTLDDQDHTLESDTLIITSEDEPVAIAGVMGGASSEVAETTTNLWLEVANFRAYTIHTTATKLRMNTEGSARWIKGVDQNLASAATARSLKLLSELAGAQAQGLIDTHPKSTKRNPITVTLNRVTTYAGTDIDAASAKEQLESMGFGIKENGDTWDVTPPTNRQDVLGEHDVIEEILRVIGYENIPAKIPEPISRQPLPPQVAMREIIRDELTGLGFIETYNYSFEDNRKAKRPDTDQSPSVTVKNPIAPELSNLRSTLLFGLAAHALKNRDSFPDHQLFETGHIFRAGEGGVVKDIVEEDAVAGITIGEMATDSHLQGVLDTIASQLGLAGFKQLKIDEWRREIYSGENLIGQVRWWSAEEVKKLKFRKAVVVFELSLTSLLEASNTDTAYVAPRSTNEVHYKPVSKYPPSFRDLSIIVDPDVTIEQAQSIIERIGGDLVADVDLFDVYQPSEQAQSEADIASPANKKSLGFRIKYLSAEKTLTDDEVNGLHNTIVATLREELAAELRE